MTIDPRTLSAVVEVLDRQFGLDALYLYGSQATGRTHAGSDVDLAGLFARSPTPTELFEAGLELAQLLEREVDLVDLDRVSPLLVRQVLRSGRLVHESNPVRQVALAVKNTSLYEDLKILRRDGEQQLLRRFRDG